MERRYQEKKAARAAAAAFEKENTEECEPEIVLEEYEEQEVEREEEWF